jgi:uncharacterized membrane protein
VALGGIVLLAAALRFSTLGVQSYWLDETYTVMIAKFGLSGIWPAVRGNEGSPPLYYYGAFLWRHVFGTSEFALRSMSALFGTLTVPAAFYAARDLVSERAGLVTALLVALDPLLIWYSQEARSYVLLVFFSTVALAFFARALRTGERRDHLLWAASSVLALFSHYFAALTILPEAVWLFVIARREGRSLRPLLYGVAGIVAMGAALLPYALEQRKGNKQGFIHDLPRATRLDDIVRHPLAGELGGPVHGFVQVAALFSLVAIVLLVVRGGVREKRGALIALGIVLVSLVIPFTFSFTKHYDYLFQRNLLATVVPMAIVLAAGFAVARGGWIARIGLAGLCVTWMVINIAVPLDKKLQREDWRNAVSSLGPNSEPRVVATSPSFFDVPLHTYLKRAKRLRGGGAVTNEVDLIWLWRDSRGAHRPIGIPGFRLVAIRRTPSYELDRYRAQPPVLVTPHGTLAPVKPSSAAFLQQPG